MISSTASLIAVRAFPAVVQAADIRALRQNNNPESIRDFVGGYLGFDERSRRALSTLLHSLSQPNRGGAFFLNGVFGSGKSHLLGLIALLCDGIGTEIFAVTHPQLAPLLSTPASRLVIHFSLDDYDASRFSLEEIVQMEIAREWKNRFAENLELSNLESRSEYFAALDEQLLARDFAGIFIAIDELSLFLSAKEHRALQADAAYLQFLGQRAARSTPCPLFLIAAIQKTVEDIGELESYSLSQIKDRFQTLPLSLAHIPSLISHRLIVHKNPSELQSFCRESYQKIERALPRLDFGPQEWETLYPFHPATIALLEQVVARFFSRTRSAAIFCAHSASELILKESVSSRVLPDAIFDYFQPELETHSELRALNVVWDSWQSQISELARDAAEAELFQQIMKVLLLCKIAGIAPTPIQIANFIALDAGLPGDGNYQYARVLLERILSRAGHLAVERNAQNDGEEPFQDRYTIDSGTRVSELARRHLKNALIELQPDDARVAAHILSCCREQNLPISSLENSQSFSIFWRNAPREIEVKIRHSHDTSETISNRVAMLAQPGAPEDLLLVITSPFSQFENGSSPISSPRLVVWKPRIPTRDEWQIAREATAAHLLEDDPQLLDNRRGRAILNHLKDGNSQRETALARLARRLLAEGELQTGAGIFIEASELASAQSWASTLEAIAEFALPHVYPSFGKIAPKSRVLTPSNADQLALEILRRPIEEPYFSASVERLVRNIAEPLGIAKNDKGRWKISSLREDLSHEIKAFAPSGSTLSAIEAHFSKNDWGLKSEQMTIAICALLRSGELSAIDNKGQVLAPSQIGMPLRRAIYALQPGQLLAEEIWSQVCELVEFLVHEKLPTLSFAAQERARVLLLQWRDETQAAAELSQARLRQLQRAFNNAPSQWSQTEITLQNLATVFEKLKDNSETTGYLKNVSELDLDSLCAILTNWQALQSKLETSHAELLAIHRLLIHSSLSTPPELQASRHAILQQLESGEAILEDENLLPQSQTWRAEYSQLYKDWHNAQHDGARWNSLRRFQNSYELRALQRLSTLQSRAFPQYAEIQNAIEEELQKHCARDGVLLPGEATCNACNLRFDERVTLRDVREIEAIAANGILALQEESARDYLVRQERSTPLLQWNGESGTLLELLNDEVLQLLNQAFKPRRRVQRNFAELSVIFQSCRTKEEFEEAFTNWIDGEDSLSADDEIVME